MTISENFPSEVWLLWHISSTKILCTSHTGLFFWLPSGENLPKQKSLSVCIDLRIIHIKFKQSIIH
jgi:hypothetical protein